MATLRDKFHDVGNDLHSAGFMSSDWDEALQLFEGVLNKPVSKDKIDELVQKMRNIVSDGRTVYSKVSKKLAHAEHEVSSMRDTVYRFIPPDVEMNILTDKVKEENKKIKIFFVDDEKDTLETMVNKYSDLGYDLDSASSAEEAIKKIEDFLPMILVTDLYFPGEKQGIDLIKFAKDLKFGVQILVVSRVDDEAVKKELDKLGVDIVLQKPTTPAQINAKLSGLIFQRKGV